MFGGGEGSLGGVSCPRNGLGSALIKCLISLRDLLSLKSALFPRLHCIGIPQAGRNVSGVGQYQHYVNRIIHSIKITDH